ncbi:MAG: dTMP kinase [Gemmatimonadota bacterium]|nr:dTMP kinase [Gemmatimonadota bacterium]
MSPPAERGPFIAFEGPEGAGKSGQIARVAEELAAAGRPHVVTREPGGTPVGERIRDQLLRPGLEVPPLTELLLFAAQRSAHVELVVRPALERGDLVLSDRYALSTSIYQGVARGLDRALVERTIEIATGGLEPDLYLVLDVPPEVGRARQGASGAAPDRIEGEDLAFMRKVREGYLGFAASTERAELVDAGETPEVVAAAIRGVLAARFPGWFPAHGARSG